MECKRAENLVDAYLDAELDPIHTMELDAHMQECARCTELLEKRRTLQKALRTSLPYFAAPAELRREVERVVRPGRRWVGPVGLAVAACAAIVIGGMGWGMLGRGVGMGGEPMLAEMVVADHLRSLQASHLIDVKSSDHHTVKPWFAGKLQFTPPVRELDGKEFKLEGGRLDVVGEEEVAALVYSHGTHVINLFVWPGAVGEKSGEGKFEAVTTGQGYHLVHWTTEEGMRCWAVSDMDAEEMMRFAQAFDEAGRAGAATRL